MNNAKKKKGVQSSKLFCEILKEKIEKELDETDFNEKAKKFLRGISIKMYQFSGFIINCSALCI